MNTLVKLVIVCLLVMCAFSWVAVTPTCDDKAQLNCLDDIYYAYPACLKAAQ